MEFVVIIAICIGGLWVYSLVQKAKADTPAGRINKKKEAAQWGMRREWQAAQALGSAENVEKWLSRKYQPLIDDEWFEVNRTGRNDEKLIEHAINHVFSHPLMIDRLLKSDQEEQMSELEE